MVLYNCKIKMIRGGTIMTNTVDDESYSSGVEGYGLDLI